MRKRAADLDRSIADPHKRLLAYAQLFQDTYNNIFLMKCARCHQVSRPNSAAGGV